MTREAADVGDGGGAGGDGGGAGSGGGDGGDGASGREKKYESDPELVGPVVHNRAVESEMPRAAAVAAAQTVTLSRGV